MVVRDAGPSMNYCSLTDPNLTGYFSNPRIRRHLTRTGLVAKTGAIVDERTYRLNIARYCTGGIPETWFWPICTIEKN